MSDVLVALLVVFGVSAVLLLLASRYPLPVVPLYLLTGLVAGVAIDEAQLLDLAQWGIAFLVFLFGVHVDLEGVGELGPTAGLVAMIQASLVGTLTAAVSLALGLTWLDAFVLAVAAALSSSLVATSYLDSSEGVRPTFQRLAESIHFTEDLLGVLAALTLSVTIYAVSPGWVQPAVAIGLFVTALVVNQYLFHRLTDRLQGDEEVLMLVGVSFVIAGIAVAEFAGLSIVVGAFAAGIAVADDYPHSLELVDTVDDLEDFFTPIFFITVGALVTLPDTETLGYVAVIVIAVVLVNPLVTAAGLLAAGYDGRTALFTGFTLDHVGAFSLFIAIEALAGGVIRRPVFDAVVLAAVLTMLSSTVTTHRRTELNRWLRRHGVVAALGERVGTPDRTHVGDDLTDHVIVVDTRHGGQAVIDACVALDRPLLAIEDDPQTFERISEECEHAVFGDVLDDRVWELARIEEAALVVSLTPETDRTRYVVDLPAELGVEVDRLVRVDDEATAAEVLDRGGTGVVFPDAIAGERVREDLEALLDEEISQATFEARGRGHGESAE